MANLVVRTGHMGNKLAGDMGCSWCGSLCLAPPLKTEQRQKFVTLANSGRFGVSELCLGFGVTRNCGHKWLVRYAEGITKGVRNRFQQ